jgi:hypothetical protein
MWRIYGGAVAFLAGVGAFIVDGRHNRNPAVEAFLSSSGTHQHAKGLSPTVYDLIHVAAWALVLAGLLLMIAGLIRYSASLRRPA